jgi:hypothetical protein
MAHHDWLREVLAEADKHAADFEQSYGRNAIHDPTWNYPSWCVGPEDRAAWRERKLKERERKPTKAPAPIPAKASTEEVQIDGYHLLPTDMMIEGVCSTPTIDKHNTSLLPLGCELAVPVPLLCRHVEWGEIGQVVYLRKSDSEIFMRAIVHDNEAGRFAWGRIESGEFAALSVASEREQGSFHVQGAVDGTLFYDRWKLREISIVKTPANPDCYFNTVGRAAKSPSREQQTRRFWSMYEREKSEQLSVNELSRFWSWYNQRQEENE